MKTTSPQNCVRHWACWTAENQFGESSFYFLFVYISICNLSSEKWERKFFSCLFVCRIGYMKTTSPQNCVRHWACWTAEIWFGENTFSCLTVNMLVIFSEKSYFFQTEFSLTLSELRSETDFTDVTLSQSIWRVHWKFKW